MKLFQALKIFEIGDNELTRKQLKSLFRKLTLSHHPDHGGDAEKMKENGTDDQGNFIMRFDKGVENFQDTVLFIAGDCNVAIGPDFQKEQMKLFPNAELEIIPDAGHYMIGEKPEESLEVIRKYLNK